VPGHPAVGVDDDLPTGQAGVAHRAAHHETAGRVDQQAVALRRDVEAGQHRVDDVLLDVRLERGGQVRVFVMLGRQHHGVDPHRPVVRVVLDGDLGLPVGT
jgi:hypothetical protein